MKEMGLTNIKISTFLNSITNCKTMSIHLKAYFYLTCAFKSGEGSL